MVIHTHETARTSRQPLEHGFSTDLNPVIIFSRDHKSRPTLIKYQPNKFISEKQSSKTNFNIHIAGKVK